MTRTPHVLLVGDLDPPAGGLATYCRYLAEGLARRGWEVTFVDAWAIGEKPPLRSVARQLGTTPRRSLPHLFRGIAAVLRNRKTPLLDAFRELSWRDRVRTVAFAGYLEAQLTTHVPDVIHANQSGVRTLACLLAASRVRVPVVIALHGSEFAGPRLLHLRSVGRRLCNVADAVIANSAFTARQARAGGVDRAIDTVLLGVDLDRYRPDPVPAEFLDRYELPRGSRVVLFAGALGANKGPLTLLEAYRALSPRARASTTCVFIGPDDGEEEELRRRVRHGGLDDVRVIGRIPRGDLPLFYRAADVFVFPTTVYEGFGLVALEAAASGCALVASRVGAIPEVVSEGENGLLVPPSDAVELARALERLLDDQALVAAYRSASPRVAARFRWDRTVESTDHVLRRVTHERRTPRAPAMPESA